MFTFGRDREEEAAAAYVRNPGQVPLVHALVDGVHDLLEGRGAVEAVAQSLDQAFLDGGVGVWEQTGSWLSKLVPEFPQLAERWKAYADHRSAEIRFRTAAFLDRMPPAVAKELAERLLADPSRRVRQGDNP